MVAWAEIWRGQVAHLARDILLGLVLVTSVLGSAWAQATDRAERARRMSEQAEARGLAEPFKGVTTNGTIIPSLFAIHSAGVPTEPVRAAAAAFLASLAAEQRAKTIFPVDDLEWRKWMNQHFYVRQGVSFEEMSTDQRDAAVGLLRASLSAKGLQQSRDIMRLNHTLGELNGDLEQYGEGKYWITVLGEPSANAPWGWQLDGHHLIINYFVLGDQVVMTPTFMGSEPVRTTRGKHQGTEVLQGEERKGLALINALDISQRKQTILQTSKTGANNVAEAFKDNLVLDYSGVRATGLSDAQKELLLDLVAEHVGNMRDGHAKVRMDEVRQHLDQTHFAWIGLRTAASLSNKSRLRCSAKVPTRRGSGTGICHLLASRTRLKYLDRVLALGAVPNEKSNEITELANDPGLDGYGNRSLVGQGVRVPK